MPIARAGPSSADVLAIFGGKPAVPSPLPLSTPVTEDELEAATRTLRDQPLSPPFGGFEIGAFEDEFAAWCGSPYAVAVSSGTCALHASLLAANIGVEDEVIVTPFSFVASVSVVILVGATPVFADIEPDSLGLDPIDVARKIGPKTRAILPVHQSGYPADMTALTELARQHELVLIEDCAGAHGASVDGRTVGTIGHYGCFSFNASKVLRTGEGGMVLTASEAAAEHLREIRVNGLRASPSGSYVNSLGSNFTMPQVLAAIGRRQVARADEMLAARRRNAERLIAEVEDLPVSVPAGHAGRERIFYELPFIVADDYAHARDAIVEALVAENVPAGAGRRTLLSHIDCIRDHAPPGSYPISERAATTTFFVDPRSCYDDATIGQICLGLRKVLERVDVFGELSKA